jgi:adenylate cyclase, class 2
MAKEQEIKFMMESPRRALRLLSEAGAVERHGRTFEDNLVLDDAGRSLMKRGILLRLRRYGEAATLTVKSNAAVEGGLKVREEHETVVGAFDAMRDLLKALGYAPVFRYQKYRTNFDLEGTVASLDETPIGTYLEIEGEPQAVQAAARRLGLDLPHGLTQSYMELFRALGRAGEMVFSETAGRREGGKARRLESKGETGEKG